MVTLQHVEEQLKRAGCNFRFWGRGEIRELCNILMPEEKIIHCVNGRYSGGFAMLAVTDHRLLLVDRKPMFMSLEDLRFDMIAEINYNSRLLDGTISVITPNRTLTFSSWNQHHLREVLNYTQQQIMQIRQQYMLQQFQPASTEQMTASAMGELAVQGNGSPAQTMPFNMSKLLPQNPYAKGPLMMRRSRFPKFY